MKNQLLICASCFIIFCAIVYSFFFRLYLVLLKGFAHSAPVISYCEAVQGLEAFDASVCITPLS